MELIRTASLISGTARLRPGSKRPLCRASQTEYGGAVSSTVSGITLQTVCALYNQHAPAAWEQSHAMHSEGQWSGIYEF